MDKLNIGTRVGLWEITGEPSLSSKKKVVATSKYPCLCHGCGETFEVQSRYLISGKSKGCVACRASQNIRNLLAMGTLKTGSHPNPGNPLCPKCQTVMGIVGCKITSKGERKYYKCSVCEKNKKSKKSIAITVKPRCPTCKGVKVYKHGGNKTHQKGFIPRYYCRDCQKIFQVVYCN